MKQDTTNDDEGNVGEVVRTGAANVLRQLGIRETMLVIMFAFIAIVFLLAIAASLAQTIDWYKHRKLIRQFDAIVSNSFCMPSDWKGDDGA